MLVDEQQFLGAAVHARAAQCAAQIARIGPAVLPVLGEELAGHPVAHLPARHAGAHRFDHAGAVGQRHEGVLGAAAGEHGQKIAIIECHRLDAHDDLAVAGRGIGAVDEFEIGETAGTLDF